MDKIKLVQCYHCYAIAEHKRPTCPYLNEMQRCPRCAQVGHKSWQCQNYPFCLHCGGPHTVTAPCCPIYQEKMDTVIKDLLIELLPNTLKPQNSPSNYQDTDVMSLLITSAFTANGSLITFINSLFTASQAMAKNSTATSPYSPYSVDYNSDLEESSKCRPRSDSSPDPLLPHAKEHSPDNNNIVTSPYSLYPLAYNCDLEMSCPSTLDSSLDMSASNSNLEASASLESLPPLKEPPDQIEAAKTEEQISFCDSDLSEYSHLTKYSEGLRITYDLEKSNPDIVYLAIPKPRGAQEWYSESQLYPYKKAMVKRKKKLGNIPLPRRNGIEVPRTR